jgi:predicted RNA-binding protein YlxR (DUF448 family)
LPRDLRLGPTRTCVGCGERDAQSALVRFRATTDGGLSEESRVGRSAYVHARVTCARSLRRSKHLTRALRRNIAAETRDGYTTALLARLDAQAIAIDAKIQDRR